MHRARIITTIASITIVAMLAACGGGDDGGSGGSSGGDLATVEVTVSAGAYVDARNDGGAELTGVTFPEPTRALCRHGVERVGVIPGSVDENEVRTWTNASEEPVVYVFTEDVAGEIGDLPVCSIADGPDEMGDTLLHGRHVHNGHS